MLAMFILALLYWLSVPWDSSEGAYGPRFFLAGLTLLILLAPRAGGYRRAFVAVAIAGGVVNHLNLIGLRPIETIASLLTGTPVGSRTIVLFPLSLRFGVATGLAVDLAYQLALVGVALMLRSRCASPEGKAA